MARLLIAGKLVVDDVLDCAHPLTPGSNQRALSRTIHGGGQVWHTARAASAAGAAVTVTEDPSPGREGERYAMTPTLGLHRATIGVHGDILVSEDRLRAAVAGAAATGAELIDGIAYLLGTAWDTELEPYRIATDDTPVRVLNHVI
ncbi:MAG: DUF3145 family protein [Actinomycetota bacterium]